MGSLPREKLEGSNSVKKSAFSSSVKKSSFSSEEIILRKKVLEYHAYDGNTFETGSLLTWIEAILVHVSAVDATGVVKPVPELDLPENLTYLFHEIACVLNCTCAGGASEASALKILKLVACYDWDAKIAIILATYVVEYAHYRLATKLYTSDKLGILVAKLKNTVYDGKKMAAEFKSIKTRVEETIEMTKKISEFGCFPSKHITEDDEAMVEAWNHIAITVYWMTRSVVACAYQHSFILGKAESSKYSSKETWSIIQKNIYTTKTTLTKKHTEIQRRIDEKKQVKYYEKLKVMFSSRKSYKENQKILQTIIKVKEEGSTFSCGLKPEIKTVQDLKGKTVLLLISHLEISQEEITRIQHFYESASSMKLQYEIVWLPIVENYLETKELTEKIYKEQRSKMKWTTLVSPSLIRLGFAKYVREEWSYSKKTIMASISPQGKLAYKSVYDMMCTWGNTVHPFTHVVESHLLKEEWSLRFLVHQTTQEMSKWVQEKKFICFFGGEDKVWIENFITKAQECWKQTNQNVEMVYIFNKSITEEKRITEIKQICEKKVTCWDKTTDSTYFWNRIDSAVSTKTTKLTILKEAASMIALGSHKQGWGLIGSTAVVDGQISITKAKGDKMVQALGEHSKWSVEVQRKGFIAAIHDHLVDIHEEHKCKVYPYPGHEAYPDVKVCSVCLRTMERMDEFTCSVKKSVTMKEETETKVEEETETKEETETIVEEETETKAETETIVQEETETTVEEEIEAKVEEEETETTVEETETKMEEAAA